MRVRIFLCVAGFMYIPGCIDGTTKTGAPVAKIVVVRRSSARPVAIRAIKSAVAGAMTIRSAESARATWETDWVPSQTSVFTSRPDKASQVALPTKLRLEFVGTTVT